MTGKSCMMCFHHLPIVNEDSSCFCTYGNKLVEHANTFWCADYDNAEEHVYTLEEVARDLLSFCNDLTDEIVFYSATNQVPPEEDYMAFAKQYRVLADRANKLDICL